MARETTEIRLDEKGDETHESWVRIGANKVQSTGTWLFDSEIKHQHFVMVRVERCTRKRDLNRDWLYNTTLLLELSMSQAQWGAFVSSFGQGGGVAATLEFLTGVGQVPQAPPDSRLAKSHADVRGAAAEGMAKVRMALEAYKARKTVGNLRSLEAAIGNMPSNMEFAAESLTEHVENVVTKARADVEAMVADAQRRGELSADVSPFQLGSGEPEAG